MAYVYGVYDVGLSLGKEAEPNRDKLEESIYRKIDGETWVNRIEKAETQADLDRIAWTESFRVFSEGQWDTAVPLGATHKKWNTMEDDRVRDSHWFLEGLKIPINEYFYTLAGERTLYPRGFGVPDEDCNCRCWLTYSEE